MSVKRTKEIVLGVLVIVILVSLVTFVYRHEKSKVRTSLAKRISELSPKGGPPETIEGLKKAIALYEAQIELNVQEGAQTGTYWKILAIRLADRSMHRDALVALERALYYNAEDPTLYYLTGVSAGVVAKSIVGFSSGAGNEREHYYVLAENSHKRALNFDREYAKPMYALGVLYAFELNRPAEAIPLLEEYLRIISSDVPAMFVIARAYYMTESYEQAIGVYDRIIARTKDAKVKAEAQNNRDIVMERMYG